MAKSKISAPVGSFNRDYKPQNWDAQETQWPKKPSGNNRRMYNEHLKAWYTSDDGGLSWEQENQHQQTPTIWQSLGFSLDLIPSGKFCTVEFINKRGEVSRYNGRTGVKKYLKHAGVLDVDNFTKSIGKQDYFVLWVRRAGIKFDSVAMIHKRKIVKLSAGGVVLWQNKQSKYSKTV